jgi:flavin reductase (DIM6/NTAB) family NADH-FMN oxidoreductase RutF
VTASNVDPDKPAHQVTAQLMRKVLGVVPTSVCVVCTDVDGHPAGSTIGSFTSVSLDPPLVAFFAVRESSTARAVADAGRFSVNVLGEHQESICQRFANKVGDRFQGTSWHWSEHGLPVIDGALATIECTLEYAMPAGDHTTFMGRVIALEEHGQARPLAFQRGRLWSLGKRGPSFSDRMYPWWGE